MKEIKYMDYILEVNKVDDYSGDELKKLVGNTERIYNGRCKYESLGIGYKGTINCFVKGCMEDNRWCPNDQTNCDGYKELTKRRCCNE